MNNIHFSSNSDEWETPIHIFNIYNEIYHFNHDVAATKQNTKCLNYYSIIDNSLKLDWYGNCWCNPPYSNVKEWIKKSYKESLKEDTKVVMLIPARTDTIAWHEYIFPFAKIEFLKGRLKFSNHKNPAPFPSAIVIFGDK